MERPNNTTLALLAGVGALILLLIVFAATRDSGQDRLGDAATFTVDDPDLNKACAGQSTYEQIKRALFRQAATQRGKDGDAYERIAQVAAVRMENPAAEGREERTKLIDCAGSLAIDLPPGITTVAGRRQLMTDIYYVVDQSGAQRRVVQLRGANGIVNDLAGLTIDQAPPAMPPMMPPVTTPVEPEAIDQQPADPLAAQPERKALPSFDCGNARTSGERMICGDPSLAELDRAMAAEYSRAVAASTPAQQALLRQTRDRFLAYRDRCPNSACVGAATSDRIREIHDIMAGRWTPNR